MYLLSDDFTVDDLREFIRSIQDVYSEFGVGAAVGLPFLETLFPFLPLFLMLAFNMLEHGEMLGFIYTYIGTTMGTIMIFIFMRYILTQRIKDTLLQKNRIKKALDWIETTHPILHILILMIPFSPTFMINYSMGLTKMKFKTFLLITTISRAILLFICIPFGMTLVTLMDDNLSGGVTVMWLSFVGIVIMVSIVLGQVISRKINARKTSV